MLRYLSISLIAFCLWTAHASAITLGSDERVIIDPKSDPTYRKIVNVDWGCTGSLVGRKIVLTAAHCIVDFIPASLRSSSYSKEFLADLVVYAGLTQDRKYERAAKAVSVYWGDFSKDEGDWAVLYLDQALGDAFGYFGYTQGTPRKSDLNKNVTLAGYSSDIRDSTSSETLSGHLNCDVTSHEGNFLVHDCDAETGASGAPIFKCVDQECFVLGVHRGSATLTSYFPLATPRVRNEAINTKAFYKIITELRAIESKENQ